MKTRIIKISLSIFLVVTLIFSISCNDSVSPEVPIDNEHKVTINQGAWGNVRFWKGDFMPMYDESSGGTITPVVRDIYIHVATTGDMVDRIEYTTFYTSINSKLIAVSQSDNDGFFQVKLAPGKYSFFVMEDSKFYANGNDGFGHILPAEVFEDSVTQIDIDITYMATY